jgi:hypothetical protein
VVVVVGRGGPLMMRGQDSGDFSTGTYDSMTSYNDIGEGGFTLPNSFLEQLTIPYASTIKIKSFINGTPIQCK